MSSLNICKELGNITLRPAYLYGNNFIIFGIV